MLDEAYERFVTKKGGEIKQERKRAKRINPDADADLLEVIQQPKHRTCTMLCNSFFYVTIFNNRGRKVLRSRFPLSRLQ